MSPGKGAAGLSFPLMFIPAVGWNNCELYFPLCGTEQRRVLLIIEIISAIFLSRNNSELAGLMSRGSALGLSSVLPQERNVPQIFSTCLFKGA